MKFSLDVHIVSTDQALLDGVMAGLPAATDPEVWDGEYSAPVQGDDEGGNKFVDASIRFNTESGRSVVEGIVTGLSGVLDGCDAGSYVKLHDCNHDGTGACVDTLIYEVV